MKSRAILILVYATLVLVGGVIGYIKANSIPSIAMGVCFSLALMGSGVGMLKERKLSLYVATWLTIALGIFFGYRFMLTGSFMPAGFMTLISLVVFIFLLTARRKA